MANNFLVTREFHYDRRAMCHYFVVSYDQCCNAGSITSALFLASILRHRSVARERNAAGKACGRFSSLRARRSRAVRSQFSNHIERPSCKYLRHISFLMGTFLARQIRFAVCVFAVDRFRKPPWQCVTIRGAEVIFERSRKPAFSIANRYRACNKCRAWNVKVR